MQRSRYRFPPDPTPPKQEFDPRRLDSLTYTKRRDKEPLSRIDGDSYLRGKPFRTRVERELMAMVPRCRRQDLRTAVAIKGFARKFA